MTGSVKSTTCCRLESMDRGAKAKSASCNKHRHQCLSSIISIIISAYHLSSASSSVPIIYHQHHHQCLSSIISIIISAYHLSSALSSVPIIYHHHQCLSSIIIIIIIIIIISAYHLSSASPLALRCLCPLPPQSAIFIGIGIILAKIKVNTVVYKLNVKGTAGHVRDTSGRMCC